MRLWALPAAGAVALLATGCGATAARQIGSTPTSGGTKPAGATVRARIETTTARSRVAPTPAPVTNPGALRRAAARLQSAPGYTFRISAHLDVPAFGDAARLSGHGSFDTAADAGQITATITPPGILDLLGEIETQILISGSDVYVLMPDSLDGTPIGGKPWGEATFAQLEAAAGVAGPDTLAGLLAALPRSSAARVWLDPQGRIRRAKYRYHGRRIRDMGVTITITHYRPESAPNVPDSSVVGGLLAAASSIGL